MPGSKKDKKVTTNTTISPTMVLFLGNSDSRPFPHTQGPCISVPVDKQHISPAKRHMLYWGNAKQPAAPQTHPKKASLSGKATVVLTLIFFKILLCTNYLILYSNFNIENLLSRDDADADADDDDEPWRATFFFSPTYTQKDNIEERVYATQQPCPFVAIILTLLR
jgi:hypothetical protein